ncbi:MAG: alanine racemase, partial [Elainella sp.]
MSNIAEPLTEQLAKRLAELRPTLPANVRLIAVSKQIPVAAMRAAYDLGIRDFAESRVQEAALKQAELTDWTDVTWHFIGRLQANKAAKALDQFAWIHSLDSLALAQRLDKLAANRPNKPNCCL